MAEIRIDEYERSTRTTDFLDFRFYFLEFYCNMIGPLYADKTTILLNFPDLCNTLSNGKKRLATR
jgi:hypothetical protein